MCLQFIVSEIGATFSAKNLNQLSPHVVSCLLILYAFVKPSFVVLISQKKILFESELNKKDRPANLYYCANPIPLQNLVNQQILPSNK